MNKGPDHLSRLEHGEEPTSLDDTLPDAQLLAIRKVDDQFAEIVQFLSTGMAPREYSVIQKKQLVVRAADFQLIAGQFYNKKFTKQTPFKLVYGQEAVVLMEYSVPSFIIAAFTNMDDTGAVQDRLAQLMELEEDRFIVGFHQLD